MDLKNSAVFAAYNNADNITSNVKMNAGEATGPDFGGMVTDSLQNTSDVIKNVESVGAASLVEGASLEELAAAVSNAEVTLKTVVAVRDRIINAYQDIIKMPI